MALTGAEDGARGHQQRGGAAARGGAGGAARIPGRLARRAGGDRRWRADPGDRGTVRRATRGGGHDQPDPPRRLRGGAGRGRREGRPACPPVQLRHERLHRGGGPRRGRGDRPPARRRRPRRPRIRGAAGHRGVRSRARAHARRAPGRRGGCRPVQRGQARGWAAGGADRRPRETSSPGCGGTRSPGRSAPTRRSSPAWPRPSRSTAPGGRRWTSPCGERSPWIRPTSGRARSGSWGSCRPLPAAPTRAWWSCGRRWAAVRFPARRCPRSGSRCRPPRRSRAAAVLRTGPDRILARVEDGEVVFDLRTVPRFHDGTIARRIGDIARPRA